jgi:hypothetical protein
VARDFQFFNTSWGICYYLSTVGASGSILLGGVTLKALSVLLRAGHWNSTDFCKCYSGSLKYLFLLWLYTPRSFTSASPMTSIHSDRFWAFLVNPVIPIIFKSARTSSNHLSFVLSTFLFPSSFASNAILAILF